MVWRTRVTRVTCVIRIPFLPPFGVGNAGNVGLFSVKLTYMRVRAYNEYV